MESEIAQRISELRQSVDRIARSCGRSPAEIDFILVSKGVRPEHIREAWRAGVKDFGENRVQELLKKKDFLAFDIWWHLIGHLQTNKVKQVLGEVVLIHSLDRLELAREIERQARAKDIAAVDCLIQVNSSAEITKFGFPVEEVPRAVATLQEDSPIRIRGLMTIGPLTEDRDKIRQAFRTVTRLQKRLEREFPKRDWKILSMGMSGDYDIAIEEGANLLRIGTAVFGERGLKWAL